MSNGNTSLATRGGTTELVGPDGEVFDFRDNPSALEAVTRAEIDIQISTAKRFPRSAARFLAEAEAMVSISPALAEKCTYSLPGRRGEGRGAGGAISGPSVRLAEIVAVCWGNLRVIGRIVDDDGKSVTAQGVCLDLERNVGYSVEVRRNVTTRDGRRFSQDMVNVTCNAAIAIATRNATFKAVPRAFVNVVEEKAQLVARGDVKTLPDRLDRALGYFGSLGVAEPEVMKALGVVGKADVTLDHLMVLQGYRTSIQEGHATADAIFRPAPAETSTPPPGAPVTQTITEKLRNAAPKPPDANIQPPRSAEAGAPPAPTPGAPVTYLLDGSPATDDDLIALARSTYGYTGELDDETGAQGAIYVLKENGHRIQPKK